MCVHVEGRREFNDFSPRPCFYCSIILERLWNSALNMDLPLRVDWAVFITRTKHLYDPLLLNNTRIVVRESWWPLNL
jgi:hypothetical protein